MPCITLHLDDLNMCCKLLMSSSWGPKFGALQGAACIILE